MKFIDENDNPYWSDNWKGTQVESLQIRSLMEIAHQPERIADNLDDKQESEKVQAVRDVFKGVEPHE